MSDKSVTETKLADAVIATAKIVDGAVTGTKLASGAVTTTALAAGAVTEAKLANGAVTSAKIKNLTILTKDLANGAVTAPKIQNGQIQWDHLDGTVRDNITAFPLKFWLQTVVIGKLVPPALPAGAHNQTFNLPGNVIAAWWCPQEDASRPTSNTSMFRQFVLGDPIIAGGTFTFPVTKADNALGAVRILFMALFV